MRFRDIPQLTKRCPYGVDVGWDDLEHHVQRYIKEYGLDLEPDFQRGYVWTPAQQTAYVEFCLRGGTSGRELYFNHQGWMRDFKGDFVVVDGKQRLNAVRMFVKGEVPVLGGLRFPDFTDRMGLELSFRFNINDLKTKDDVLRWYLEMNSGGTIHTAAELEKVRKMIENEKG